jgi:site-specific DNA-methyltransferase (adenine-specific)
MDENTIKLFGSKQTDHWQTPPDFLDMLDGEFHFTHDPCPRYPIEDGLLVDWGRRVFVNPPYSGVKVWLQKAHKEIQKGSEVIVFLTFSNTDTDWFHRYCYGRYPYCEVEIRFVKGRLKFISDDGVKNSAMRPSMLVILRKKLEK